MVERRPKEKPGLNRSCRTSLRTGTKAGFYKGTLGGTIVPYRNFSVRFNPYFAYTGDQVTSCVVPIHATLPREIYQGIKCLVK